MKARQLIGGAAAFGPDTLKVITKAFDDAWAEIEPSVTDNPLALEAARLRLANIVLSLAKDDNSDLEPIKTEAVRLFHSSAANRQITDRTNHRMTAP